MGWFNEQIKSRKSFDDKNFDEAMKELAATAARKKLNLSGDERENIKNAIDDILNYYHVPSKEIPERFNTQEEQLEYLCRPNGIMRRSVKLEKGWYKDAVGAMLGKKKDGTAVALIPGALFGYSFHDEASGRRVRLNASTEALLDEEAICFYKPLPQHSIGIIDLLKYILACITPASRLSLIAIMLASTLLGLLMPKVTYIIFSQVVVSDSMRLLLAVLVLYMGISTSTLLVNGMKSLINDRISTQLDVDVQAATMARILSLPAEFFKDYSSGELASRSRQINSLCSMLCSSVIVTGLTSVFSLAYISQIWNYAPALVVPALSMLALTLAFTVLSTVLRMREERLAINIGSKKEGMTYALINGVQKIKLAGAEKRAFARWARLYREEIEHTYGVPTLLLTGTVNTAITLIGTLVMYCASIQSGLSVAEYSAFIAAYGMVSGAFLSTSDIVLSAAAIKPVLEMAKPILEAVPETSESKQVVSRLSGSIELSHVSFRYDESMPMIIDDMSLTLRPGQYVAIVGKTGCGKSTLVRLLLGFEKPKKGAVYFDGKDINTLDLKSLRRNIGTVIQNGKLFYGSIYHNIAISAPGLTLEDAWEAAELAGLAEDIRRMPMGMNTVISEGAGGISGGQRQRLMIARAIAPKPKLLIFDEATSALDNITQKKVSQSLDSLKCTRLVIAHRLSTIRQCDRILVLDGGHIIEDGSYEELLAKDGFFAELVARQRIETGSAV